MRFCDLPVLVGGLGITRLFSFVIFLYAERITHSFPLEEFTMATKKTQGFMRLEQWLRWTLSGDFRATLGKDSSILGPDGSNLGQYNPVGGRIAGRGGTDSIARWSPYPGVTFEAVTHHLFKQTMITRLMLGIEKDYGNPHSIRSDMLIMCAVTHDLLEALKTDVNYHDKVRNAEARAQNQITDRVAHDQMLAGLRPEWRGYFPAPIDVNLAFSAIEREFWDAAEYVGYSIFMLEEVRLGTIGRAQARAFVGDTVRYIERLEAHAKVFISARELLEKEIRPMWLELSRRYPPPKKKE